MQSIESQLLSNVMLIGEVGQGNQVCSTYEAECKTTMKKYHLTIYDKKRAKEFNHQTRIKNERAVRLRLDHPMIQHCYGVFGDPARISARIYFFNEAFKGSELIHQLRSY